MKQSSIIAALAAGIVLTATLATAHADDAAAKADAAKPAGKNPACLTETGSRIAAKGKECTALGRTHSQRDIAQTGATNAADALRLTDPSLTVHR